MCIRLAIHHACGHLRVLAIPCSATIPFKTYTRQMIPGCAATFPGFEHYFKTTLDCSMCSVLGKEEGGKGKGKRQWGPWVLGEEGED